MKTSPDTLVLHLTVEELVQVIKENIQAPAAPETPKSDLPKEGPTFTGRILYGVSGIEKFFNVSHKTASEWKKTWLKPATKQNGRKIMTDAEYALKLYDQRQQKA